MLHSITQLGVESLAAGERALAMILFTYRNCGHEVCKWLAWHNILGKMALWRNIMRRPKLAPWYLEDEAKPAIRLKPDDSWRLPSIRFVAVLEQHESGWPHGHMVARLLPSHTEFKYLKRRGKRVTREVAVGHELARAKAIWRALTGAIIFGWEVVASRPGYVAEYLCKLSKLPMETQAFLFLNRSRMFARSNGLKRPESPSTEYEFYRGNKYFVAHKVGLGYKLQDDVDPLDQAQRRIDFDRRSLPELGSGGN